MRKNSMERMRAGAAAGAGHGFEPTELPPGHIGSCVTGAARDTR